MTQNKTILKMLTTGHTLTALDAVKMGIFRLASRVNDLRCEGWPIATTMITRKKKRFALYTLTGDKRKWPKNNP
jgi:hypothetical protein